MKLRAWLTALFTLTFVLSPLVADPFAGFRADQLPVPQVDPPAQPAGWAFSIWGLIYLWLLVSAVFGVLRQPHAADWHRARAPLALSLALGTFWLPLANLSAIGATLLILPMTALAILALLRAPERDGPWLRAPLGLYAGWLTAASFVALASTTAGYALLPQMLAAYLAVAGALAVAVTVLRQDPGPAYGAAVAWALIGIIAKNGAAPLGLLALAGALLIAGLTWRAGRRGTGSRTPKAPPEAGEAP